MGLIDIRKAYAPFTDSTNTTIENMTVYNNAGARTVAFMLENKIDTENQWDKVICILNADTENDVEVQFEGENLPEDWVVIANADKAGVEKLDEITGTSVTVSKTSAMILVDKVSFESADIKVDTAFKESLIKNTSVVEPATEETTIIATHKQSTDKTTNDKLRKAGIIAGVAAAVAATATIVGIVALKKKKKK